MRYALRLWGAFFAILAVITAPYLLVAWLAGVTGVLVLFGAVVVGFFVWLTVIEVQDEKARAGYAAWREKHRDRSYS
jgi:cobalamin biosynthesis protein CobD/CbiB